MLFIQEGFQAQKHYQAIKKTLQLDPGVSQKSCFHDPSQINAEGSFSLGFFV